MFRFWLWVRRHGLGRGAPAFRLSSFLPTKDVVHADARPSLRGAGQRRRLSTCPVPPSGRDHYPVRQHTLARVPLGEPRAVATSGHRL